MEINPETRIDAYVALDEATQAVYAASHWQKTYPKLTEKYAISDEERFIDLIGDYILGLHNVTTFINSLTSLFNLDETIAQQLIREVDSFKQQSDKTMAAVDTSPVMPMRTMADDMQKAHGYGALPKNTVPDSSEETTAVTDEPVYRTEQETVLKPKPVAAMPAYNPDTTPTPATPQTPPPDTRWHATNETI